MLKRIACYFIGEGNWAPHNIAENSKSDALNMIKVDFMLYLIPEISSPKLA